MIRSLTLALAATILVSSEAQARAPQLQPVFRTDFPDPFVLPHAGRFYAYATNATRGRANVQMAESSDLTTWKQVARGAKLHDALPVLPAWAQKGWTWAPEVLPLGDRFVLYFTAKERATGLQCVGVGEAKSPLGPFVSAAPQPLVCQRELGGSIDPSAFRDKDGSLHLLWKNDGNNPAVNKPARIFSQRLSPDGLSLTGAPAALLTNGEHWEWRVIESPTMVRRPDGGLTLLYSGNHFGWEADQRLSNYAMGYARCASLAGPCVKATENPVLKSYNDARGCLSGPGHQTVFTARGREWLVFHAWDHGPNCTPARLPARHMYIVPLEWRDGAPIFGRAVP